MTPRKFRGGILLSALLLACGQAQDASTVCDACDIRMEHVTTLGEGLAEHNPTTMSNVVRAGDTYVVSPTTTPNVLGVFDTAGEFVRAIGGTGQAPGQFKNVFSVYPYTGDTLLVWERGAFATLLTTNGSYVRHVPIPLGHVYDLLSFHDSIVVASPDRRERSGTGPRLAILNSEGELLQYFGEQSLPKGAKSNPLLGMVSSIRILARAPDGFWALPIYTLRAEHYDRAGNAQGILAINSDLMGNSHEISPKTNSGQIIDAVTDDGGLLWILLKRRNPRPNLLKFRPPARVHGEVIPRAPSMVEIEEAADFWIIAVNTSNGNVVASRQLEAAGGFIREGEFFTYDEDEVGLVSLRVWRLSLQRKA